MVLSKRKVYKKAEGQTEYRVYFKEFEIFYYTEVVEGMESFCIFSISLCTSETILAFFMNGKCKWSFHTVWKFAERNNNASRSRYCFIIQIVYIYKMSRYFPWTLRPSFNSPALNSSRTLVVGISLLILSKTCKFIAQTKCTDCQIPHTSHSFTGSY